MAFPLGVLPSSPDDLVRPSPRPGEFRRWDGARAVRGGVDLLAGVLGALDEAGPEADTLAERIGRTWAERSMPRFSAAFGRMTPDGSRPPTAVFWSQIAWALEATGWGKLVFQLDHAEQGVIVVELWNSIIVDAKGLTGDRECHLYAGMLAGAFSWFHQTALEAIEINCGSSGDACCRFLIGEPHRVDQATFLLQDGASWDEILKGMVQR